MGRRTVGTQAAEGFPGRVAIGKHDVEALGEIDLEDVAGMDIGPGAAGGVEIARPAPARGETAAPGGGAGGTGRGTSPSRPASACTAASLSPCTRQRRDAASNSTQAG